VSGQAIPTGRKRRRIGIIACGVFEWNLRRAAARCGHECAFHFLPAGLHADPKRLREELVRAIDRMEAEFAPDAIVVGFGLCGRGVARVAARRAPLVLPRCEDCTAVFLGSQQRYRREFLRRPGTYYSTCGWVRSRGQGAFGTRRNPSLYDPTHEKLAERYGEENARFILDFRSSWRGHYQRAAYIRFPDDPECATHRRRLRALADAEGWEYEELPGSETLFERLVSGDWDHPEILVVHPGEVIVPAPGAEVLAAGPDAAAMHRRILSRFGRSWRKAEAPRRGLGLGIDTGGTFTDSVIYDFATGEVLSKSKAPTTHHDLAEGIADSLAGLDRALLRRVERAAVSTTLATNAIVEGKGQQVGLLLTGIAEDDLARLDFDLKRRIPGRRSMEGGELEPIDPDFTRTAVRDLRAQGARAFAVSGYAATVNPEHEIAVARIAREETGLPVVCGHELTRRLNLYHRANTAGLNARLLPLIADLLRSVRAVLGRHGLGHVRLTVVRGDGSHLLDRCALEVPVETILSGPAASVVGAVTLSGERDAVVADMGGTTLDVAVVHDGEPVLDPAGAQVGGFHTAVRAMRLHTVGLGCDSEIHLEAWPRVRVGPRRLLPLAVLADEHPAVLDTLRGLDVEDFDRCGPVRPTEFVVRRGTASPEGLSRRERETLAALDGRPVPLFELGRRIGVAVAGAVPLARLEAYGLVVRSSLTPTDLLHVEGRFNRFRTEAAVTAMDLHAAHLGLSRTELCEAIRAEVSRRIVAEVLRSELADEADWDPDERSARFLVREILARERGGTTFSIRLGRPLVPVGAPVQAFFPPLADVLGADVRLPPHVEVANAVGAVAGRVALVEQAEIALAADGAYQVRSRVRMERHFAFEAALEAAENLIRSSLAEQAVRNEVPLGEPRFIVREHTAMTNRGPLFLGVTLTGRLTI